MDRRVIYRCLGVWLVLGLWGLPASTAFPQAFDIVLAGGRVMDPESRLDAVRYVGIRGDKITEISARPLEGTTRSSRPSRARGVADEAVDLLRKQTVSHGASAARFQLQVDLDGPFTLTDGC